VRGSGVALVIGILVTFYGGLGVANASQDAMNRVWAVPHRRRPGFLPRLLRSLMLIATLGLGILATTVLNSVGAGAPVENWLRVVLFVVAFLLNIGLFAIAFRVLTARDLGWADVLLCAVIAAFGWAVLQAIGGLLVSRMLEGTSQTYGLFAIVIGLLAYIFLLARIVLYAAEANVVRARRLWPRSLAPPPLTDADMRALEAYARTEERRPEQRIGMELQT
jgi:uncharacterized BrkB/YihY/UPF0761 family membrane protein